MKKKDYPKLLIISHNLYDISNNIGKTLVSLLNGWPKDKLAQIYFRNDIPSFKYSNQYYCITDKEILKSVMTLRLKKAGKVIANANDLSLSDAEVNMYTIGNHRHPFVSFMRDFLWDIAAWKTKELECWIKETVKPDLILFVPNDYSLAYKVALHINAMINKPIVPFYMDDAFYWNCNNKGMEAIRRYNLRRLANRIHKYCKEIFTICEYMSEEYEKLFNRKCYAYVNSVKVSKPKTQEKLHAPIVFTYLGNLHSNRWKSLVEIGKVLEKIQKEESIPSVLKIYSGSVLEKSMEDAFSEIPNIQFMGSIPASLVRTKQMESDFLVHIEAFDEKSIRSTRLSLSTKIPEYLSTGVPVFAYGPKNISSMRYLYDNRLGHVCFDAEILCESILQFLIDPTRRREYALRGIEHAAQFHDIEKVSTDFINMLVRE